MKAKRQYEIVNWCLSNLPLKYASFFQYVAQIDVSIKKV